MNENSVKTITNPDYDPNRWAHCEPAVSVADQLASAMAGLPAGADKVVSTKDPVVTFANNLVSRIFTLVCQFLGFAVLGIFCAVVIFLILP